MNRFKVLVADYDGTLINDERKITPKTMQAILAFMGRGGKFVVCTGRMTGGIDHRLKKDGLNCLLASYNGGELVDLQEDKVLYSNPIDSDTGYRLFKLLESLKVQGFCYHNGTFVCTKNNNKKDFYAEIQGRPPILVDRVSEYIKENQVKSVKILVFDDKEKLDENYEVIKKSFPELQVIRSNNEHIDINLKGVTKGNALGLIANALRCSLDDIVAVGDNGNDVPMLKQAKFSVAMGNAPQAVKDIANTVVADNNLDGIKELIEKYCI